MNIIYTAQDCRKCDEQKARWDKINTEYEERPGGRLKKWVVRNFRLWWNGRRKQSEC